jgi:hypothetical protein
LPFVHPKLSVVATFEGKDFASALDRAIERSARARLIEAEAIKSIEAQPSKMRRIMITRCPGFVDVAGYAILGQRWRL